MGKSAQKEFHSDDIAIDQKPDLSLDLGAAVSREEIVRVEQMPAKDYAADLAFMEEPVTIRLSPSAEKNASNQFPVTVNGKGGEMFLNGKWVSVGWFPVGISFITKRKYVEVIIRAKVDRVETEVIGEHSDRPQNKVRRFTTPVHSFTTLKDTPAGHEWAAEMIRRNM